MKKVNWGKVFETISYLAGLGIGFAILYFGFSFIWAAIKSIF